MKKKLRSRRGLTIVELTVTILLLGVMSIGVAAGVSSSLYVYRESTLLSDAETLCDTLTEVVMDELRFACRIDTEGDPPSFESKTYGYGVRLAANGDGYLGIQGTDILLLQRGAYTGLTADIDYDYNGTVFDVTITVAKTVGGAPIQTAHFQVAPN